MISKEQKQREDATGREDLIKSINCKNPSTQSIYSMLICYYLAEKEPRNSPFRKIILSVVYFNGRYTFDKFSKRLKLNL